VITARQAALRAAAVACLIGLALVQSVELSYTLARGGALGALSGLLIAGCLGLSLALVVAGADEGRAAWRAVAGLGAVVLAGWALTRLAAIAGLAASAGHWTTRPGLASAALALVAIVLAAAGAGARPTRALARSVVTAVCTLIVLSPGATALVVALAPGPSGEHGAAEAHAHAVAQPAFRPGFGGHAGHYVYPNAAPPHLPSWALALVIGAAAAFLYGAVAALTRRSGARDALGGPGAPARVLAGALVCVAVLGAHPAPASAHAALLRVSPAAGTAPAASPHRVVLGFSEPVQILRPGDVSVVDSRGRPITDDVAQVDPRDARVVTMALRARLAPDSYTVRWRVISADSHTTGGALVFGVAGARLKPPVLKPAGGLSETGPLAVDGRFAELATLGLLLGLLAFRRLVWARALASGRGLADAERRAAIASGQRTFWRAFWASVVLAGAAEAYVLAAKSAAAFGLSLGEAIRDPSTTYGLVASSRFGDLIGWRAGALCALVALGFWEWAHERERPPSAGGRALPQAALAGLSLAALTTIATQGHASQAPAAPLEVAADAIHLGAVAVWIGGLACLAGVLGFAPRALSGAVLARFSRVAAASFALVAVTGVARAAGELHAPAQLWHTAYGHSLLAKLALLVPIALLALRTRRAIATRPAGTAVTAGLRRGVQAELVLGATVILVAALLVAQVPGR
jgi:copper transport protein